MILCNMSRTEYSRNEACSAAPDFTTVSLTNSCSVLALKIDDSGLAPPIPTITIEDTDKKPENVVEKSPVEKSPVAKPPTVEKERAQRASDASDEAELVPGAMPPGPAPVIPDWYVVGWRQASGIDKPPLSEGDEKDKGILDMFLAEQYYGDWYHNAGIIIFVCTYQFICIIAYVCFVGCTVHTFPDAFPFRLGMDVHHTSHM